MIKLMVSSRTIEQLLELADDNPEIAILLTYLYHADEEDEGDYGE